MKPAPDEGKLRAEVKAQLAATKAEHDHTLEKIAPPAPAKSLLAFDRLLRKLGIDILRIKP